MTESNDWLIVRKAMAFDLISILRENPQKESYTPDEIEKMLHSYIDFIEKAYSKNETP